jgi:hypothetical protein
MAANKEAGEGLIFNITMHRLEKACGWRKISSPDLRCLKTKEYFSAGKP